VTAKQLPWWSQNSHPATRARARSGWILARPDPGHAVLILPRSIIKVELLFHLWWC
jgi:hypothetical protein